MPIDATVVAKAAEDAAKKLGIPTEEPEEEEAAKEESAAAEEEKSEGAEEAQEEEEEGEDQEPEEDESNEEGVSEKGTVPKKRFNKVYGKMKQYERAIQYLMTQQAQPVQPQQPAPKQEETKLPDFETMTEKEKMLWVIDTLGKKVDAAIEKKVEPVITTTRQEKANREVAECSAKHSDYMDYANEMVQIANKYPFLGAEDVYILAKGGEGSQKAVRDIARKTKAKIELKKKASTEKRSSPSEK